MIEFCSQRMPRWHPVSISGYHIREAGSTAQQELAFTLKDGFTYVEQAIERGLDVDDFAPRLSFFFNAHIDFFEEIAKYRAARRIWARELRDTYGAKDERSLLMRCHSQTAGVSLTAQQPLNNITRTAIEALAAVLGGTQSLHTNSLRRGAGAAHREGGEGGAAHPAGDRGGDRASRTRSTRSAAPTSSSRSPTGWRRRPTSTSPRSTSWAGWSRRSRQLPPARDRGRLVHLPAGGRLGAAHRGRRERLHRGRGRAAGDPAHRPRARAQADRPRGRPSARGATPTEVERTLALLREAAAGNVNLMDPLLDCARAHATEGEIVESLQRFSARTRRPRSFEARGRACGRTALAAAPAQAAVLPGQTLDGPSADIRSAQDVSLAADGTGAVAYIKDGRGRRTRRSWCAAGRRVGRAGECLQRDADIADVEVEASNGGRLLVVYRRAGNLLRAKVSPGTGQPFGAAIPLDTGIDGFNSDANDAGVGYVVALKRRRRRRLAGDGQHRDAAPSAARSPRPARQPRGRGRRRRQRGRRL